MVGLIRFFTYLFFIVFPLGLLIRIKISDNIFITPLEIIIAVIFLLLATNARLVFSHIKANKFVKYQAIFILIGFLSLLTNAFIYKDINLATSFPYLLRYSALISLVLVGQIYATYIGIKKAALLSGFAFVILGFLQYLFVYDLRPYTVLGWDDHLYRLVSTFIDPNFSGIFYALFAILLFFLIFKKPVRDGIFEVSTLFLSGVAVFATYSRSALLSLIGGIFAYLVSINKARYILIVLLMSSGFLFLFSDVTIEGLNPFRTVSTNNRLVNLSQSIDIAFKNPIFGVGFNAYRDAQIRYNYRDLEGSLKSNADAGTDNSLIFVITTTGLLGFNFFAVSYAFLLISLFKEKGSGKAFFAMFVSVIIGSMFVNALFYVPVMSWLLLVTGFRKQFV